MGSDLRWYAGVALALAWLIVIVAGAVTVFGYIAAAVSPLFAGVAVAALFMVIVIFLASFE